LCNHRTDFNRLRLEIITDGSISPQDALEYASNLLVEHFTIAGQFEKKKIKKAVKKTKEVKKVVSTATRRGGGKAVAKKAVAKKALSAKAKSKAKKK